MDEQFITTQGSDDPAGDCRRRGLVMAATTQVTKDKQGRYRVRSQSSDNVYTIDLDNDPTCTCPDFILTSRPCKHIFRVLLFVQWEQPQEQPQEQHRPSEGKDPPVRTKKKTYPQNWQAYDSAQTHELEHFDHLLWELCRLLIQPQYQFARPPLPIADVVYAVATKAQRGMSRRRSMTDVRRAQENGFVDHVPADSSVSRYLSKPELKWLIIQSALPLASLEQDFAIDSSGIASTTYDRWYDHKWGRVVRKAQWVKMHLLCGVRTKIVIAADVSEAEANDSPFLQRLVNDIQDIYDIKELSADKAYLSRTNFEFAEGLDIDLYVPFKTNSTRKDPKRRRSHAWERAHDYFTYRREEFLEHYHKRSISESVMNMVKAKYGPYVRSKNPVAQYNEVLAKVLCHNISCLIHQAYELGIEDELQQWVSKANQAGQVEDRGLSLVA